MISSKHSNKPKQYIKGYIDWYKLKLKVTPDVLIPRPETELLVDEILKDYPLQPTPYPLTILDIGTGSGNIAISIARNTKDIKIIATDISEKALKVAKQNARLHGVSDKIKFIQSDLLESVILNPKSEGSQDSKSGDSSQARNDNLIIVTNLPYIPSGRIPTLDSSVKDFEPHIALDGGENGFNLYEELFMQIKKRCINFDLFVGEIDCTQDTLAASIAKKYFPQMIVEIKNDLTHLPRILIIKKSTRKEALDYNQE